MKELVFASQWIVDRLDEKPGYIFVISVFFGVLCSGCGIVVFLKDRGLVLSAIGFALVGLGILTPLLPWWLLFLWLVVG